MPVIIEGHISVESDKSEGAILGGKRHYLCRVENQSDIIE